MLHTPPRGAAGPSAKLRRKGEEKSRRRNWKGSVRILYHLHATKNQCGRAQVATGRQNANRFSGTVIAASLYKKKLFPIVRRNFSQYESCRARRDRSFSARGGPRKSFTFHAGDASNSSLSAQPGANASSTSATVASVFWIAPRVLAINSGEGNQEPREGGKGPADPSARSCLARVVAGSVAATRIPMRTAENREPPQNCHCSVSGARSLW